MYRIAEGTADQRQMVGDWLEGLDRLSAPVREKVVTAWVSAIASSAYDTVESIPYSVAEPSYGLKRHVNDVTRVGIELSRQASAIWDYGFEPDALVSILILHDLDKPLIYAGNRQAAEYSPLGLEIPHGVVGGMMLRELGFPQVVVSTVTTHAANAPFHGRNPEAWVLHYADMFATDHVYMTAGLSPFYQKHLGL